MNAKKIIPIASLLFLVATFAGGWWLLQQQDQRLQEHQNKTKATSKFTPGPTNQCQKIPAFTNKLELKGQLAIDTEQRHAMGISFVEARENGQRYQHPSWDDVGHIGGTVRDQNGNIFVLPVPVVSLEHNRPESRNTIYMIDTNTQEMQPFLALGLSEGEPRHPFGVLGITMDCDTNSLYVSSVEGSQPNTEKGTTYQIDLATKKIIGQINNKDLFGLGVLNTPSGKRLYYGLARLPHIYSVSLDGHGRFGRDHRYEISLAELPEGDSATPVKIRFSQSGNDTLMTVQKAVFNFRPSAANEFGRNKYVFRLANDETWEYLTRR